ncbi:MAG: hypothetical protein CFE26_00915 [Verrucomicrobiales bacterium VVV1]|nr:MAG: hypothetical protein CFE26_00915 [Verrucomicrobiales bacterium VVV1]
MVALGGIVILCVWLYGSLKVPPRSPPEVVVPPVEVQPTLEAAREVIRRYFESMDDEGRISCLHEKDRVGPLWRDFYHRRAKPFSMLDSIQTGKMVTHEGKTLALFVIEQSPGGSQPIALFWEGDRFAIDWESHVAYGTMDWIEWVESKPSSVQVLRVYLSETRIGDDGSGERRVAVEHHDSLGPEVAVIPKSVDFPIDFSGRQRVPVTAEFQFQGPTENRNLVMVRLIHEGWSR